MGPKFAVMWSNDLENIDFLEVGGVEFFFFLAEGQIRSQISKKTAEAKGLFFGYATKSIDFFWVCIKYFADFLMKVWEGKEKNTLA